MRIVHFPVESKFIDLLPHHFLETSSFTYHIILQTTLDMGPFSASQVIAKKNKVPNAWNPYAGVPTTVSEHLERSRARNNSTGPRLNRGRPSPRKAI